MYTMISPSLIVFFYLLNPQFPAKKEKAKKQKFLLYIILYMHHCSNVLKYNI